MTLTWWEWEELLSEIEKRPSLWEEHPSRALTFFRKVDDTPVYALQAIPQSSKSEYRLVSVIAVPITWTQEECDSHLSYLRESFTSFQFRDEVERFFLKELSFDEQKARLCAIIIGRMQQGPVAEPLPESYVFPNEERILHLREGGVLTFRRQGEMLRCHMHLSRMGDLGPTSSSFLLLDGFMRVRGTEMRFALDWLDGSKQLNATIDAAKARIEKQLRGHSGPLATNGEIQMELEDGCGSTSEPGSRDPDPSADPLRDISEEGGDGQSPRTSDPALGLHPLEGDA